MLEAIASRILGVVFNIISFLCYNPPGLDPALQEESLQRGSVSVACAGRRFWALPVCAVPKRGEFDV